MLGRQAVYGNVVAVHDQCVLTGVPPRQKKIVPTLGDVDKVSDLAENISAFFTGLDEDTCDGDVFDISDRNAGGVATIRNQGRVRLFQVESCLLD